MSRETKTVLQLEDAPPVCSIDITAQLLGRSVRAINEDLRRGIMQPPPIPVIESSVGPRKKHKRRQWSKFAIETWLKGEYLAFVRQAAPAAGPKTRKYFGKAHARVVGSAVHA